MAKKAVSKLRKASNIVKVVKAVKSEKTGAYQYREEMINKDDLNDYLKK